MTNEQPLVEDFFRSVPENITTTPIFSDEDGTWFAYGHLEPHEMVLAIHNADQYNTGEESELKVNPEDIQYCYAKITGIDPSTPDWDDEVQFTTCKPSEEGAFPVSVWNY